MSADQILDRVATEWLRELPATKAEGEAHGFDGRAWLSDWLEAHARDKAEEVFLGLDGFMEAERRTLADVENHIYAHGLALIEAWGNTMAAYGADGTSWTKAAADRAALAYSERMSELMAVASDGGRA